GQFTLVVMDQEEPVPDAPLSWDDPTQSRAPQQLGEDHWSLHSAGIPYLVELLDKGPPGSQRMYGAPRSAAAGTPRFAFTRSTPKAFDGRFALPIRPAEYSAATAVLAPTTVLDRLSEPEWTALAHWV